MVLAAGLLLALVAVLLVLEPVLRGAGAAPAPLLPDSDDEDDVDPVERRRDLALAALKEIEFDRATGKLSDDDYERLLARYTAEAAIAIQAADAAAADPVEHLIAQAKAAAHGLGTNGRRRYCTSCGASLEGARAFCTACGTRIAA